MAKRRKLVGAKGVDAQRTRRAKSEVKAVAKGALKGDIATEVNRANTREAIKRVGEYKTGRVNGKDYKPPTHGKRKK